MTRPIYWLHLSDLHFGAKGKEILHQAEQEFLRAVEKLSHVMTTPPDLILVSGDIAFSGKAEEYEQADAFFDDLYSKLKATYGNSCNPILIAVPGNHDLIRPTAAEALFYDVFNRYAEATNDDPSVRILNDTLWDRKEAKILQMLFPAYIAWWEKRLAALKDRADVNIYTSHIPGDVCLELNIKNTFPLSVIGLNSSWLQYNDGNFDGRLCIPTRQFQALLPHSGKANPLDFFKKQSQSLLMMHHPPSWFSPIAQNRFSSEIFIPDRFSMCLYGHMHAGRARQTAVSGGAARYEFQSPSLCGLEYYGTSKEERAFGFSAGSITQEGEIRVWPYNRVALAGGEHAFLWDQSFGDGAEHSDGVLIRSSLVTPPHPHPILIPETPVIALEGALLHVKLINVQRAEHQRITCIEFLNGAVANIAKNKPWMTQVKQINYNFDGEFTWFLSRLKGQKWGSLLEQALQIALELVAAVTQQKDKLGNDEWIPQIGTSIHVEYDAHDLSGQSQSSLLIGEGIDYVHKMLPQPIRPYIILSSEAYRYLRPVLANQRTITHLLKSIEPEIALSGQNIRPEITHLTISNPTSHREYPESHDVYNLCIRSQSGELLLGDAHIPPNQIRVEPSSPLDSQILIDRLVNADRVFLIGVTNEHLNEYIQEALNRRRDFWDEIKIIFLSRELLSLVADHRQRIFDNAKKATQDRVDHWERSVRGVRELFLSCDGAGFKWECLEYNHIIPFEAQRYTDGENSTIRIVPILPNIDSEKGYYIEATSGSPLHEQLSESIDTIIRTATPIAEFNVYGHPSGCGSPDDFCLAGVVSQRHWRHFEPPDGLKPCFPVSFIIPHTDVGGVQRILLQKRTPLNTGGDFDLYSLISGKVNDEDFFHPNSPSTGYQQLAYQVSKESDDNLRVALSMMFARENNLVLGRPVPREIMNTYWKNTAVRELGAELGLHIDPERLADAYASPFLLDREESDPKDKFQLFIKLYTLELQPEELAQIPKVRPHANLEPFNLEKMTNYKNKKLLSVFLCTHFDEYILPLLLKMKIT